MITILLASLPIPVGMGLVESNSIAPIAPLADVLAFQDRKRGPANIIPGQTETYIRPRALWQAAMEAYWHLHGDMPALQSSSENGYSYGRSKTDADFGLLCPPKRPSVPSVSLSVPESVDDGRI